MVSVGGVRRFVSVIMVAERGDATGAWYWKGLPIGTLKSERQKCGRRHELPEECIQKLETETFSD
jgi:hypothetical protein